MSTQHAFRARVTEAQLRSAYRCLSAMDKMSAPERMNLPAVLDQITVSDFLPPDFHFWRFAPSESEIGLSWCEPFSAERVYAALQPPAPSIASLLSESIVAELRSIAVFGEPYHGGVRQRAIGGFIGSCSASVGLRRDMKWRAANVYLRILNLGHRFSPEWALLGHCLEVIFRDKVTGKWTRDAGICCRTVEKALQIATSLNSECDVPIGSIRGYMFQLTTEPYLILRPHLLRFSRSYDVTIKGEYAVDPLARPASIPECGHRFPVLRRTGKHNSDAIVTVIHEPNATFLELTAESKSATRLKKIMAEFPDLEWQEWKGVMYERWSGDQSKTVRLPLSYEDPSKSWWWEKPFGFEVVGYVDDEELVLLPFKTSANLWTYMNEKVTQFIRARRYEGGMIEGIVRTIDMYSQRLDEIEAYYGTNWKRLRFRIENLRKKMSPKAWNYETTMRQFDDFTKLGAVKFNYRGKMIDVPVDYIEDIGSNPKLYQQPMVFDEDGNLLED